MKRAISLVAVAAFALTSVAQDSGIDLSWKPVEGETRTYKVVTSMMVNMGAGDSEMVVSFNTTAKNSKVEDDKVTAESSVTDFRMMVDGQEFDPAMAGGAAPEGQKETTVFSRSGKMISTTAKPDQMSGGPRVQRLSEYRYPETTVPMGGEWTVDFPADKTEGVPEGKAKFTLEKEETVNGIETYRIKHVYSEMSGDVPFGAMGTIWLDKKTRELVKSEAEWQNVQFVPMMPPTTAKVSMTLVKR